MVLVNARNKRQWGRFQILLSFGEVTCLNLMTFCSRRRAGLLWQFRFGFSSFFSVLHTTLISSGLSVDGYFQSWLHCCEYLNLVAFENNSNFLPAEVNGWHFCFICKISDLTFS